MRVIVGCEFSGVVRDAFIKQGHDAYSCDLLPSEKESSHHIEADLLDVINYGWDMGIFFPPCTHLASSGARWFKFKQKEQQEALAFIQKLMAVRFPYAIENPIGVISSMIRKPDQIIQPWMFGHGETKATCLWLRGLPELLPTNIVDGRHPRVHLEPPGPDRWKNRSRTYQGVADAMAAQWGVVSLP